MFEQKHSKKDKIAMGLACIIVCSGYGIVIPLIAYQMGLGLHDKLNLQQGLIFIFYFILYFFISYPVVLYCIKYFIEFFLFIYKEFKYKLFGK
jgi:uncharacterized membrane protein